jgi:hypothetical protein
MSEAAPNNFVSRAQCSALLRNAKHCRMAQQCAAEPGPSQSPFYRAVPVLRSGVNNAAARPGHDTIR